MYYNFKTLLQQRTAFIVLFFGIIMGYLLTPAVAENSVSLSATLSKTAFPVNSTASLNITVNGAQSVDIRLPEVKNLVFHSRGQSSRMQIINGSYSSSVTYSYLIEPQKEGNYTIPAFEVKAQDATLTTEPLSFEVTAAKAAGTPPDSGSDQPQATAAKDLVFLTVSGLKDTVYIGEIIPVEIKAYFRRGIRVEIKQLPQIIGDSFVLSPLSNEPEQTVESFKGKNYSVITWNSAASPIKEGTFDFAVNLDATLHLPQQNRTRLWNQPFFDDDFFNDDIFDGLLGGLKKERVNLKSKGRSIAILPIPQQGRPQDFSGAVGSFDFKIKADPKEFNLGDPVGLTMTISGKGNFDRVSAPLFPEGDEWKTYSPTAEFESSGSSYEGKKIFEQAIVAKKSAVSAIPSLQFSYFDPDKKSFITKTTSPLPITIKDENGLQPQQQKGTMPLQHSSTQASQQLPTSQPVQMRLETGTFTKKIAPYYQRLWFIFTIILCTCVLLGVVLISLRRHFRTKNEIQLKKDRLHKMLRSKSSALKQAIDKGNDKEFLQQCREIIQEKLAYDWQMEPSAISHIDLQNRLPADSPLIQIFSTAEAHVYGGLRLSPEKMATYYNQLREELGEKG